MEKFQTQREFRYLGSLNSQDRQQAPLCSQIKMQITLWKCFSLFFDHTRKTAWLGSYLRHLKQMPGAVWCETGPKKRSEEGAPHFSAFVVWNPLVQQQRETTWTSCAIPLRNCKVALTMSDGTENGNLFWTRWLEAESDRVWGSTFWWRNEWTDKNKSWPRSNFFVVVVLAMCSKVYSSSVHVCWAPI